MTAVSKELRSPEILLAEIDELRWQLKEANHIINNIRNGEADTLLASDKKRSHVNTDPFVSRTELAIRESRYRGLFSHLHNPFMLSKIIVDESARPIDFEYVEFNSAFGRLIGCNLRDVVGRRGTEVAAGFEKKAWDLIELLGYVALEGQQVTYEEYHERTGRWYRTFAYSPERGYFAAISEDITESRKNQEQQKRYAIELAATNKELKSFATIIAHDFRAPMLNLKGFSKELCNSLDELKVLVDHSVTQFPEESRKKIIQLLENDVPDALQFINSSVDRLDRMVATLLELARLGRREIVYKKLNMQALVESVLQSFTHQIEQQGIQVKVGMLPEIETDSLAMEQIIGNLLDNAIKYLEPERPSKIDIDCTVNCSGYTFSVHDNGRGIAAEDQEKIFWVFARAGKQDVPGEGMGLSYIRTLSRMLGGRVWCESELGIGTKMNFTLPRR
ncbi:MAG: HAMP domain-containing histidine kinase [Sporomusaceae bacterium]|nr:HAMP domain-containing histidine kinase [Sporomusaceae bacterium]